MTNREIDALVAEKVMGHAVVAEPRPRGHTAYWNDFILGTPVATYSTNISDAWQVVDKLKLNYRVDMVVDGDYYVYVMEVGEMNEATAETAPMAICLAALKAVGVEL